MSRPTAAVIDHTGGLLPLVQKLEQWCDVEFFDRPDERMLNYTFVLAHPDARDVAALRTLHYANTNVPFIFPLSPLKEHTIEGAPIHHDERGAYIVEGSDAHMESRIREILVAHEKNKN